MFSKKLTLNIYSSSGYAVSVEAIQPQR